MAEYVNIRVRKDTYERLKELSAGVPLVRFLDDASRHWESYSRNSRNSKDEADVTLEQLDKQAEETYVDPLIRDLEPDELPECCQSIYGGSIKERCEHWVDKRPAGFYNTLTHKWASDPDYYKYV